MDLFATDDNDRLYRIGPVHVIYTRCMISSIGLAVATTRPVACTDDSDNDNDEIIWNQVL